MPWAKTQSRRARKVRRHRGSGPTSNAAQVRFSHSASEEHHRKNGCEVRATLYCGAHEKLGRKHNDECYGNDRPYVRVVYGAAGQRKACHRPLWHWHCRSRNKSHLRPQEALGRLFTITGSKRLHSHLSIAKLGYWWVIGILCF